MMYIPQVSVTGNSTHGRVALCWNWRTLVELNRVQPPLLILLLHCLKHDNLFKCSVSPIGDC